MNYRNRGVSWLLVALILGIHFHQQGLSLTHWLFMGLQFLVYPHLVFLRARQARDPLKAELQNMLLDNFCFGVWGALLGFPLWIFFALIVAGAINLSAFAAGRGALQAMAAVAAGAALVHLLGAARAFSPDTCLLVSLLSMAALGFYLYLFARGAHQRTIVLHETRLKLRQSETALQGQLQEIRSLQARLTEQATRDPLTGLYNRRYLDDSLQRELDRCARDGQPLSLLLIDLDHFKQINDRHGHGAGDEVLRQISALLLRQMRSSDICCRYGGEEFLLVLPGVDQEAAIERAELCRRQIAGQQSANKPDDVGLPFAVTLSIGVACSPDARQLPAELIERADRALYRAKAEGRNRVCVAGGAGMVPA
jgi:diguanylate cyclase (GGDEF)-like protein